MDGLHCGLAACCSPSGMLQGWAAGGCNGVQVCKWRIACNNGNGVATAAGGVDAQMTVRKQNFECDLCDLNL